MTSHFLARMMMPLVVKGATVMIKSGKRRLAAEELVTNNTRTRIPYLALLSRVSESSLGQMKATAIISEVCWVICRI